MKKLSLFLTLSTMLIHCAGPSSTFRDFRVKTAKTIQDRRDMVRLYGQPQILSEDQSTACYIYRPRYSSIPSYMLVHYGDDDTVDKTEINNDKTTRFCALNDPERNLQHAPGYNSRLAEAEQTKFFNGHDSTGKAIFDDKQKGAFYHGTDKYGRPKYSNDPTTARVGGKKMKFGQVYSGTDKYGRPVYKDAPEAFSEKHDTEGGFGKTYDGTDQFGRPIYKSNSPFGSSNSTSNFGKTYQGTDKYGRPVYK